MRSVYWIIILILFGACEQNSHAPVESTERDIIARYDGGQLSFAEVEERVATSRSRTCRLARQRQGGGSLEVLVPCYRETAERRVIERLILADIPDVERAIESLDQYPELRQQAFLIPFYRRLAEDSEISDQEIAAHFEEHRERYRRPRVFTLWNIFRRYDDPTRVEETHAFLRSLKERFAAGETFAALAREYSQSETRLRDGLVGQITEGQLPTRLEEIALALADGEVSDPVPVAGGAVLLHVRHTVEDSPLSLDNVRQRIRQELRSQKQEERITQRIAGRQPPADATVLTPEDLLAALDSGEKERTVLALNHVKLTVDEFRKRAGLAQAARTDSLDEDVRQAVLDNYQNQVTRQLLLLELLDSADAELREEAEEQLRTAGISALVDEQLETEIWQIIDSDPQLLRLHYDDNRPHYQSPLRFKLHVLDLPFDDDPPRQLAQLEQLREALIREEIQPAAVAARMNGAFRDLGWVAFDDLAELIPDKAQKYLVQTDALSASAGQTTPTSGFSVPYQQDEALHLLWVEERQEPQTLAYEDVATQVRDDYFQRFQQELSAQVITTRLAAVNFVFDEEVVRQLLLPPDMVTGS